MGQSGARYGVPKGLGLYYSLNIILTSWDIMRLSEFLHYSDPEEELPVVQTAWNGVGVWIDIERERESIKEARRINRRFLDLL